jgi:Ca2+-binding RTX toxin-like protein
MSESEQYHPYEVYAPNIDLLNTRLRRVGQSEFLYYFFLAFEGIPEDGVALARDLPEAMGFSSRNGGTELFRADTSGDFAGFELVMKGTGFTVDGDGNPTGGTTTGFEVFENGTKVSSFVFLQSFAITDLLAAIEAGTGDAYNPIAYADFAELLVPSFGFLIGTGSDGADTFYSSLGDDEIDANAGNDVFFMLEGNDQLDGDAGRDLIDARYVGSAVTIDLAAGTATYGGFTATLTSIEDVIGSAFDDTIKGSGAKNWLFGNEGNDMLFGRGGKDTFAFMADGSTDRINDFQDGTDKIDLKLFDFKSKAQALHAFEEVGSKRDNRCEFSFEGTTVQIIGADRFDISGADIII